MVRSGAGILAAVAAAAVIFGVGCRDSLSPRPDPSVPPDELLGGSLVTGNLRVTTATTGASLDPDGYTVSVSGLTGSQVRAIGTNGSVTFSDLLPGVYHVQLSGAAANCSVAGPNPRTVTILILSTVPTTFGISCTATSGQLRVSTETTGSDVDPAYTVTVDGDGGPSQTIGPNAGATFTNLPAGNHQVFLGDVAENCTVAASNPRTVSVAAGVMATTTFHLSCTAVVPVDRVVGQGQFGAGSPAHPPGPENEAQTFDFDVRSDLTGRLVFADYRFADPAGGPARVTVDPAGDPMTRVTAYRTTSEACAADPSRGVEFDGVGRLGERLENFTVAVCDNGPAASHADLFGIAVPGVPYNFTGVNQTSGDIAKSGQ